jgi:hypothetical protein
MRRGWIFVWGLQLAFVASQIPLALWPGSYGYAEGAYWQTLLNLSRGYHLYADIFYSQLPGFAFTALIFAGPGDPQLWAARLGCVFATSFLIPANAWIALQLGSPRWACLAALVTALSSVLWSRASVLAGNTPAIAAMAVAAGALLNATSAGRFHWGWGAAATLAMAYSLQLKPITVGGVVVGIVILRARLGPRAWTPGLACGMAGAALTLGWSLLPDPAGGVFSQLNAGALREGPSFVMHEAWAKMETFVTLDWGRLGRGNLLYVPLMMVLSAVAWRFPERRRLVGVFSMAVLVLALPVILYPGGRPHHFYAALPAMTLLMSYVLDTMWEVRGRLNALVSWALAAMVAGTFVHELRLDAAIAVQAFQRAPPEAVEALLRQRFQPGTDIVVGEAQAELARSGFVVPPYWVDTSDVRFRTGSATCADLLERLRSAPIAGIVIGRRFDSLDCGRPAFEAGLREIFGQAEQAPPYTVFHERIAAAAAGPTSVERAK